MPRLYSAVELPSSPDLLKYSIAFKEFVPTPSPCK